MRKLILAAAAAFALVMPLTACQPGSTTSSKPPTATSGSRKHTTKPTTSQECHPGTNFLDTVKSHPSIVKNGNDGVYVFIKACIYGFVMQGFNYTNSNEVVFANSMPSPAGEQPFTWHDVPLGIPGGRRNQTVHVIIVLANNLCQYKLRHVKADPAKQGRKVTTRGFIMRWCAYPLVETKVGVTNPPTSWN